MFLVPDTNLGQCRHCAKCTCDRKHGGPTFQRRRPKNTAESFSNDGGDTEEQGSDPEISTPVRRNRRTEQSRKTEKLKTYTPKHRTVDENEFKVSSIIYFIFVAI